MRTPIKILIFFKHPVRYNGFTLLSKSGLKAYVLAQAVEDITFSGLPYYKLQGNGDLYLPAGKRNTFKFHISGGTSINDLPPYDVFMTGGPEDLPGYYRDEIQSSSTISAELSYRFELLEKIFLQTGISGAFLNGNISGGVSAGIHADTPVGPLSIVYGKILTTGKDCMSRWDTVFKRRGYYAVS